MQRITRFQSRLALAETSRNVINLATTELGVPAQSNTKPSNVPQLNKRKHRDISDAIPGLDGVPASKRKKTDVQSNAPQLKPAVKKESGLQASPARSEIDIGQVTRSNDLDDLRWFLQSSRSTPSTMIQLLHRTVDRGWLEGFDALVQSGAMTESQNADLIFLQKGQFTLFQKTVLSQNGAILDRLAALECPMYRRSRAELKGAIALAAHTGNPGILEQLCAAADVERVRWSPSEMGYFFKAAVIGTRTKSANFVSGEAAIEYLRRRYPDSVDRSSYDDAVLAAVKLNNWDAASSLLGDYGANPDAQDPDEQTTLMHAAKNGLLDVYELLRFHDASPHTQDADGNSVLHHAVEGGNERIVSDLVGKCKVNTKVSNAQNKTASGLAGMLGRSAINDLITWGVHQPFDSTDY
jgi:hypothetical protein